MTAEEMVRQAGELHDKVHEVAALVDYHTHVEIGWAPEEAIPVLAEALQEMYSLARAETAKAILNETMVRLPLRLVCDADVVVAREFLEALASRYAETPKEGM